jgi:hypothetical protein
MACGLALLASGQAMAANYASSANITAADLASVTNWLDGNCLGSAASTISLSSADTLVICGGHSLTLGSGDTLVVVRLVFTNGNGASAVGTFSGTLKFDSGNKIIVHDGTGVRSIGTLDLSVMATGNTITIDGGGSGGSVAFGSVTGKNLECPASTAYTAGSSIAAGTVCTVGAVVTGGGGGAISASIDLNYSKQVETFTTEIELK